MIIHKQTSRELSEPEGEIDHDVQAMMDRYEVVDHVTVITRMDNPDGTVSWTTRQYLRDPAPEQPFGVWEPVTEPIDVHVIGDEPSIAGEVRP